jgi:hypothetical protein
MVAVSRLKTPLSVRDRPQNKRESYSLIKDSLALIVLSAASFPSTTIAPRIGQEKDVEVIGGSAFITIARAGGGPIVTLSPIVISAPVGPLATKLTG